MAYPAKAPVAAREIDGDLLLHDERTGSVHRLNSVAALIWHLSDGKRDRSAITAEVATIFGKAPADIAADVDQILARFNETGLINYSKGLREHELLLGCVQAVIAKVNAQRIAQRLENDIDWAYLLRTAFHHGVTPLLYRGLQASDSGTVPITAMTRLERHYRANLKRNRLLFEHLLELLALFERNDIPAIPFKGPVLALLLYGDVGLREFGDLDIFVPTDRAARAKELLVERGCRLRDFGSNSALAEYGNHGKVRIDLQWGFNVPRFRVPIDVDRLWSRIERVSVGGATVLQPAPGDQIVLLNVHAAKHCWSRLKWISDIAAFIEDRTDVDWRSTMEEATQLGGARLVLVGTHLANDLFGTGLPDDVLPRLRTDTAVASLATELRQRLFGSIKKPSGVRGSYGNIRATLLHIRARERVRDKLSHVTYAVCHPFRTVRASMVPNEHDRAFIAVPPYLALLYYVIRPIRLTTQYAAGVRQRVHRYSSN